MSTCLSRSEPVVLDALTVPVNLRGVTIIRVQPVGEFAERGVEAGAAA